MSHRLQKDLETFKSDLDRERAAEKAAVEGTVRQAVETRLGDLGAERQYALEAKKRLYTSIGPLRFQLLLACRDLAGRVQSHGLRQTYDVRPATYYGRSTLYRILRPLCLTQLIEKQIAYADFSVDAGAVDLLRFQGAALAAFSGGRLVEGHPKVDWNHEREHVFFDRLRLSAHALTVQQPDGFERAMQFQEFERFLAQPGHSEELHPFPSIFDRMSPSATPLFWLRLVAYAHLCNDFINRTGTAIGFERRVYPVRELLAVTDDPSISGQLAEYVARCEALPNSAL